VIYAAYSATGLNAVSNSFHAFLRSRPRHPTKMRPVLLNIWEAVYFDHDYDNLRGLADIAASCGVERFVVDDGWFHGRRNDRAGLGDWWVDTAVWTSGLTPLIDHVRGLAWSSGYGLNRKWSTPTATCIAPPRLDTRGRSLPRCAWPQPTGARSRPRGRLRVPVRHLDALLRDHDIDYVKWDMNRDIVAATSAGRAGVHRQTLGVYACSIGWVKHIAASSSRHVHRVAAASTSASSSEPTGVDQRLD